MYLFTLHKKRNDSQESSIILQMFSSTLTLLDPKQNFISSPYKIIWWQVKTRLAVTWGNDSERKEQHFPAECRMWSFQPLCLLNVKFLELFPSQRPAVHHCCLTHLLHRGICIDKVRNRFQTHTFNRTHTKGSTASYQQEHNAHHYEILVFRICRRAQQRYWTCASVVCKEIYKQHAWLYLKKCLRPHHNFQNGPGFI